MKGLNPAEVAQLLSQPTGKKGIYGPKLMDFFNGDELAINPRDVWPTEFKDVKIVNLAQNFRNAATKAKILDLIQLRVVGDNLFIVHVERANLAVLQLTEQLDATDGETGEEATNSGENDDNTEA